jgi:ketosteroid isomerase-like protein
MMMIAVLVVMTGCATAGSSVKLHDPEVTLSLEAFVREGFDHLAKNDIAWWKSNACPEAVVFDTGDQGQPVKAKGKVEIDAMLDGYQKMMDSGVNMTTTLNNIACRSSSVSGHCVVEFDQSMTTPDGKTMSMKLRGTAVAEKLGSGKWIWSHWHASPREMPTAPDAVAAAAPAAPAAAAP